MKTLFIISILCFLSTLSFSQEELTDEQIHANITERRAKMSPADQVQFDKVVAQLWAERYAERARKEAALAEAKKQAYLHQLRVEQAQADSQARIQEENRQQFWELNAQLQQQYLLEQQMAHEARLQARREALEREMQERAIRAEQELQEQAMRYYGR